MTSTRFRHALHLAGLWLVILLSSSVAVAQDHRRKVIIDDEGFGLMHLMLLDAPDVNVVGITTVSGNVWANRATALALRGVEIAGRTDVPVVQGATYPLLNSDARTDRWEALYGKLAWKGAFTKPQADPTSQAAPLYHGPTDPVILADGNAKIAASPEIAASFLIRMVRAHPGEITIVAAGPLTNLALAQRLDPQFAALAKALVYMGGSLGPRQILPSTPAGDFAREYVNTPRREFNLRFDPEAASIVLHSPWRHITLVPVDPATATQLSPDLLTRLAKVASPAVAQFIAKMEPGFPLWDEVAAAVWIDPTIVTDKQTLFIDANTQFGAGYGDLLSWDTGNEPGLGEQRAEVVRTIDPTRLETLMTRLIANVAPPARQR